MPYIWPAFSSKRRIKSIWRSAWSSWAFENSASEAWFAARSALGSNPCAVEVDCLDWAAGIIVLHASGGAYPIAEFPHGRKSRQPLPSKASGSPNHCSKSSFRNRASLRSRRGRELIKTYLPRPGLWRDARQRAPVEHESQIVRIGVIEKRPGTLVQHI